MMLNFFLQLGSLPAPPPVLEPEHSGALQRIGEAIPYLVVGGAVLAMLLSILLRYNQRFREFWERHVCAWMEEHAVNRSDETKGGM